MSHAICDACGTFYDLEEMCFVCEDYKPPKVNKATKHPKQRNNYLANITREEILDNLIYYPDTGVFLNRKKRAGREAYERAGSIERHGRRVVRVNGVKYLSARLAWCYMTGDMPTHDIDHIDGNPLNDAWRNLRLATASQNCANSKMGKNNKSGVKGVHWSCTRGRWIAKITVNRRDIHLGTFKNINLAAQAYAKAAKQYFGSFARPEVASDKLRRHPQLTVASEPHNSQETV